MKPLIESKEILVEYDNKVILDIEKVSVYGNKKIGIIGKNGSGKSTLMRILSKQLVGYDVSHNASVHYMAQNDWNLTQEINYEQLSKLQVNHESDNYSGGEVMRTKLAEAFSIMPEVLILDEPTNNLDSEMKESLKYQLIYYPGTIILVSHDRNFLNEVVEEIWELKDSHLSIYPGNYEDYEQYKSEELKRQIYKYEKYQSERQSLENQKTEIKVKSEKMSQKKIKKTEQGGRLSHAKGSDSKQKNLNRKAKEIDKRISRMDKIERVKETKKVIFTPNVAKKIYNPYPIKGINLNKSFGERTIFRDFNFAIPLNSKIGIIGPNGSGKTTLIRMIIDEEEGVEVAQNSCIGYFKQDSIETVEYISAISYLMDNQTLNESVIRGYFSSLGFEQNKLHTSMKNLSGGEIMKLVLGKMLLSENNIIILDEPTNNLDIESIEALELMLRSYDGTVLLISHDDKVIKNICDDTIKIPK